MDRIYITSLYSTILSKFLLFNWQKISTNSRYTEGKCTSVIWCWLMTLDALYTVSHFKAINNSSTRLSISWNKNEQKLATEISNVTLTKSHLITQFSLLPSVFSTTVSQLFVLGWGHSSIRTHLLTTGNQAERKLNSNRKHTCQQHV